MAGGQVQWYAGQLGWPIRFRNIIVEGETDRDYFRLADKLFYEAKGRRLLGDEVAVFPTGSGDQGGTYGIVEHFPIFRKLIDLDVDAHGKTPFRCIALVDGDSQGKNAFNILTSKYTRLRQYRDVLILQRELPRATVEPKALRTQIENANKAWRQIDCEIEDLVSYSLLDAYVDAQPKSKKREPILLNDGHHFFFQSEYKRDLFRFVEDYAGYTDVDRIIETLRSMRFYLGVDPDGIQ